MEYKYVCMAQVDVYIIYIIYIFYFLSSLTVFGFVFVFFFGQVGLLSGFKTNSRTVAIINIYTHTTFLV